MARFTHLPLDLLPHILEKIRKTQALAQLCRVNRTFYTFAVPLLYEQILVFPWHQSGKQKVRRVFDTLSSYPHLASHVLRIEIRDFPRGLKSEESDNLFDLCLRGLANCTSLVACTWTRDGSLNSEVLHQLRQSTTLRSLTINGQDQWKYDPNILLKFTGLQELSIIMPSPAVLHTLERSSFDELQSFSLICKSSTLINDDFLAILGPRMPRLQRLHLTNCPNVTDISITHLLADSNTRIVDLALEGTSSAFDLNRFAAACGQTALLSQLLSITLTAPARTGPHASFLIEEWMSDLLAVVASSPLERLHVYASDDKAKHAVSDDFVRGLVGAHHTRLRRLSVHRMGMSTTAIAYLCQTSLVLEELFVTIADSQLSELGPAVAPCASLRSIHLNLISADGGSPMVVMRNVAIDIVRECGPAVMQFGCSTRVWQVVSALSRNANGELEVERTLGPYEAPEIPEQFLVVRT